MFIDYIKVIIGTEPADNEGFAHVVIESDKYGASGSLS
jgi:hypothetical protein